MIEQKPAPAGIRGRAVRLLGSRHGWALVLAALAAVYALVNFGLPRVPVSIASGFLKTFVVQPILWAGVGAVVVGVSHYGPPESRVPFKKSLLGISLLLGGFQVSVLTITGLFTVFGRSPYAHGFPAILYNVFFWATPLVAIELTRAYFLTIINRRFMTVALIGLGLAFAFIDLPWVRYASLSGAIDAVPFVGGVLVPNVGENVLASYLALAGGPVASVAYRGVLEAFEWLMPVLPDPAWIVKGFVGMGVLFFGLMVLQALYTIVPEKVAALAPDAAAGTDAMPAVKGKVKKKQSVASRVAGWGVVVAFSVLIIMFGRGSFGVRPGVVLTGSMSPAINAGDVVLTKTIAPEEVVKGDVIQYQMGAIMIWHRVMEVRPNGDSIAFITKGDANDSIDPRPIQPDQLRGKVVFRVPKLGKVSLALKDLLNRGS